MVFLSVFTSLARRYRMLPNGQNFISYSENTNTSLLRERFAQREAGTTVMGPRAHLAVLVQHSTLQPDSPCCPMTDCRRPAAAQL